MRQTQAVAQDAPALRAAMVDRLVADGVDPHVTVVPVVRPSVRGPSQYTLHKTQTTVMLTYPDPPTAETDRTAGTDEATGSPA